MNKNKIFSIYFFFIPAILNLILSLLFLGIYRYTEKEPVLYFLSTFYTPVYKLLEALGCSDISSYAKLFLYGSIFYGLIGLLIYLVGCLLNRIFPASKYKTLNDIKKL